MSDRQLNLDDVAEYLHISPERASRLFRQGELPFNGEPARPRFSSDDLDAWASRRILQMDGRRLDDYERGAAAKASMDSEKYPLLSIMSPDRIFIGVNARTRASILSELVSAADSLGFLYDPRDLLDSLRRREDEGPTALPGGVAIPHPRHHDPYLASESFLIVARPSSPIHFGAPDGKPTDIFFLLVCQDNRLHLRALARLCAILSDQSLAPALRAADTPDAIYNEMDSRLRCGGRGRGK